VAANDCHFITTWRIAATLAEISSVLGDAAALARWWPSVHLRVMPAGEESLRLELARRHAAGDPAILAAIPSPPGPTFPHNIRGRNRGRGST
jgi:hypothetical protein